ncbi:MAG: sugar phosphate nucleotidyltransferase [Candidatus Izemoplasmatales bacterium]
MKKTIVAMILVGGKGVRLKEITKDTAKPAVSFGAKYRLIDFTLSNLANSNVDVVGIVTQYEPYELMNYIGSGASWDLDNIDGGVRFLTPYSSAENVMWQKGTAHAVRQYFSFVREFAADYVLILSGDHIYKMDYQKMLAHHVSRRAVITIAGIEVDWEDPSRYGIIETDAFDRVVGFEEKPVRPKSNLASMGVYLFNTRDLERLLAGGPQDELVDFGKNVIPHAIRSGEEVSCYRFGGYWRDVGTVESLYRANMDMLDDPEFLGLNSSKNLPVYSRSLNLPPHVVLPSGSVRSSVIADGSTIDGTVVHSTVAYRSVVMKNAHVEDCVLLPDVFVSENATLRNVIVNAGVIVPENYRLEAAETVVLDTANLTSLGGRSDE